MTHFTRFQNENIGKVKKDLDLSFNQFLNIQYAKKLTKEYDFKLNILADKYSTFVLLLP